MHEGRQSVVVARCSGAKISAMRARRVVRIAVVGIKPRKLQIGINKVKP
jgi:hypothetical protein